MVKRSFTLASICFSTLFLLGCCTHATTIKTVNPVRPDEITGKMIDPVRLKAGGKILVVPFTAGENVAQTPELDKTALRLVRGFNQEMQDQSKFIFLNGDKPQEADLLIKGRIVRATETKKFPKVFTSKYSRVLAIEGEILAAHGGEPVALFSGQIRNQSSGLRLGDLAETLGERLARFILSDPR